jgi:hypothetical protein
LRRGATPGKIESGFQATEFIPSNPQVPLDLVYAVDPWIFHTQVTGTKVNEMLLTSPEGLKFMCRQK